ncbi:MAG TPA: hypothetical protein P5572_22320, partial [Phycisphaerae bacterium]|nr:hypothetical protein [Phycisphaerae bacterium]
MAAPEHFAETPERIRIAGLDIALRDAAAVLAELDGLYAEFDARGRAFAGDARNSHLCRAGCSHCCRSGAVFAVTLAEAVHWALAIRALPETLRTPACAAATRLMGAQARAFAAVAGPEDIPGVRDEALFSARITHLNRSQPACPLLFDDLCGVYDGRPLLCRAYGFPVDAYAVEGGGALVFRSLCVLYEGMELV